MAAKKKVVCANCETELTDPPERACDSICAKCGCGLFKVAD